MQFSVELRNARANCSKHVVGPTPMLLFFGGDVPRSTIEAIDAQVQLVGIRLADNWLSDAANGMVGATVVWMGFAEAKGIATFFRIVDAQGKCHLQGRLGEKDSGADMEIDSVNIGLNQPVKVETFAMLEPHA